MADTLLSKYGKYFQEMTKVSTAASKIDETCVYQEANEATKMYMNMLVRDAMLPDSCLNNSENFKAFYDAVTKEGKHGLIMLEHFSNMDLPGLIYLLQKHGEDWSTDLASRIVAIAGMKLNESDPGIRAFTECFSRVVVYPSRSLAAYENSAVSEEEKEEEAKRAKKINFAAMRAMDGCKRRGQVIAVFPSGTRYRPGKPETKKGLREMDSYLRLFDIMILVSINGNCLRINPESPDNMLSDLVMPDKIVMTASPIIECKKFRNDILATLPADCPDPKVETVAAVMKVLEDLHEKTEQDLKNK